MKRLALARVALLSAAALLLLPDQSSAQYFGRNKVRYRDFDFRVLKTEHFDLYYYPEEKEAVELAGRMAERWYARLSQVLDHDLSSRQPLILYASHAHFEQTNAISGELGEGTGGVTESLKRRIVMPMAGALAETDHVLGHEIVHAFQYDIAGQGKGGSAMGALRLPLWFIEGMAEYLSVGPVDPHTSMWLRDAARRDKLPTIGDLDNPRYFPYRYGQALWAYLAGRYGDEVVGRALKTGLRGGAENALERVTDTKVKLLSEGWHAAIKEAYAEELSGKAKASEQAKPLVTDRNAGELNVGPALSPDGQSLVFLSEKSQFAVEMFLADAGTGRVRDRVVKTAADPHFDSLQFIDSSGAFAPDGRRFTFAAVKDGRPALVVRDVEGGNEREVILKTLDEVHDPTWSPDGKRVAFSGNLGGLLDLYVYDLETDGLKRLTQDAYAEMQPAWSPDGTRIAFVTDRFTTDLATLDFGEYRLGLVDVASGQISPLTTFEGAKSIDPQWSADGRDVFFLSDRGGITNVYRLDVAGGALRQVTDLFTGVSGITALSPALTVARDRLVMSVYEDDKHALFALEGQERMAGRDLREARGASAAVLPPRDRNEGEVQELIADPRVGLPRGGAFATQDYSSKLSLDQLSQVSAGVGSDPLGTYVSGGVAFGFSDMLGDHNVGVIAQVDGGLKDLGGLVGYENRKHRLNWGAVLQQIPYRSGIFRQGITTIDGERALLEEATIFRETHRGASAYASYPAQPLAAVRAGGRLPEHRLRRRGGAPGRVAGHRTDPDQRARGPAFALFAEPGRGQRGARLRLHGLRGHRAHPGPPLPAGGGAHPGLVALHGRAGRRAAVRDAAAALHVRLPAAALRPLRDRRRGPAPRPPVPGLPEPGARLRPRLLQRLRVRSLGQRGLPGVRPAGGQPAGRPERGAALPAVLRPRRPPPLRSGAHRPAGVLRHRRGLDQTGRGQLPGRRARARVERRLRRPRERAGLPDRRGGLREAAGPPRPRLALAVQLHRRLLTRADVKPDVNVPASTSATKTRRTQRRCSLCVLCVLCVFVARR